MDDNTTCNLCDKIIANNKDIFACNYCQYFVCYECINSKFNNNYMMEYNDGHINKFVKHLDNLYIEEDTQSFKVEPCKNNRCKSCDYINTTNMVKSTIFGTEIRIPQQMNCASKNELP